MRKFYQFALATAIVFALVAGLSHLAFAQKVNIKDGPLKELNFGQFFRHSTPLECGVCDTSGL